MREERNLKHLKLITVAKKLNKSHSMISRIENGRYLSFNLALLLKLADYYELELTEISFLKKTWARRMSIEPEKQ